MNTNTSQNPLSQPISSPNIEAQSLSQNVTPTPSVSTKPSTVFAPQPTISQPVETLQTSQKPKKKGLIIGIVIALLIATLLFFLFMGNLVLGYIKAKVPLKFSEQPPVPSYLQDKDEEEVIEKPITKPLLAPEYLDKRFWEYVRNEEISVSDAQRIMNGDAGKMMGFIQVSQNENLTQKEEYKGIPIMWSDNQPIPAKKIEWIKKAIDLVPSTYLERYPINGIYSGTKEDLGITVPAWSALNLPGIVGFASGGNIFLTSYFTTGKTTSTMYQGLTEDYTIYFLIHEWTHIAQNYEQVKMFKEDYLLTGPIVYQMTGFIKDYAKTAGWVFDQGENKDDGSYLLANLGQDSQSQKMSSYGKTRYLEDQAEAFALFFTCQGKQISQARIGWIEKEFGVVYSSICTK